jgi:GNAT superfamily N-acetyltransferase
MNAVRPARGEDLATLNSVITAAISSWQVSERVKRLSLPLYHYTMEDLADYQVDVALNSSGIICALTAWGPCDPSDLEELPGSALLHGIFVHPNAQGRGLGRQLFTRASAAMRAAGYHCVLVKASKDAVPFFLTLGLTQLPSAGHRYPYRFWYSLR